MLAFFIPADRHRDRLRYGNNITGEDGFGLGLRQEEGGKETHVSEYDTTHEHTRHCLLLLRWMVIIINSYDGRAR